MYRSGLGSKENPLNNTKGYYAEQKSALRGFKTGAMHGTEQKLPGAIAFPS